MLLAVFIVRGLAVQCLYPPLEGPDEYQHIAVMHYIAENRSLPVFGQAAVPRSLYDDIVAIPHPNNQAQRIGARSYETFYSSEPAPATDAPIRLYQAQHPPLYYLVMAPLYSWSRGLFDFPATVYLLRCINIVLAACALVLLLAPLRRILADRGLCRIFSLAVAASPMFMIYVSRVANDVFALFFAGMALVFLLRIPEVKRTWIAAGLTGLCIGLAVLSKLSGLVLVPLAFVYLVILAASLKITWRCCAQSIIVCAAVYLLVAAPYHLWVYSHYGSFLFDQATQKCQSLGLGLSDVLAGMRVRHIHDFLLKSICLDNLWTSGWTFLQLPRLFKRVYALFFLVAAVGACMWLRPGRRSGNEGIIADWRPLVLCLLLTSATTCALYLFALKHLAGYNFLSTPSYYFMIAYPAFLSCLLIVFLGFGRRTAGYLALLLIIFFTFCELYGLCILAVPYWSQTQGWSMMLSRLTPLHPAFPSPAFFFALYCCAMVLLAIGIRFSYQRRAE